MDIQLILFGINSVLFLVAIGLSMGIINAASRYFWHNGNPAVQAPMKWRILKLIVALVIVGLGGVVMNVISTL